MVNHPNAGAAQDAQDALIGWVYDQRAACCGRRRR